MRQKNYRIRAKAKTMNWKLPLGVISLKLFTYWALTMGDWLIKFS
ncbi:putative membrane protein [Halobacteriovorax marinus SJ]|uniref:Membrane protein n=1 Tax=Halobacteriovorax marinus (strain ATCC BAA-682 / DSM 15412 / SJ) TaxID=862908 RepID=E1X054_HALMS|nr:hypothetical protein [Halobacteriovorax marinus]CBW26281.1 putative membrane protein [Halobacteriovorax marinus SJ]